MASAATVPRVQTPRSTSLRRSPSELQWVLLAVAAFIAVSIWWLTQDSRVQDWDNGLHTLYAFDDHDFIASGQLKLPFTIFNTYPPLVHLVGALGVFVGGKHPAAVILASNLIFVPMLALSCYGIGRLVYGPRAGLLAALFALGTPMFASEMHAFILDPPEAATIAASVWAILASRRFERIGLAALAGVVTGLALLTKETAVLFVAGLLAVVVLRGGWRNWRGLLVFAVATAAIAGPWYAYHASDIRSLVSIHEAAGAPGVAGAYPPLGSLSNLGWYFWNALDTQLLLPLTLAFVVGLVLAARACLRRFTPDNLLPELLAGGFVSWLAMTLIRHKDPRYTLPALVYIAVIGGGWIATTSPRLRRVLAPALILVAVVNFVGVSFGVGHAQTVAVHTHPVALYSPDGYVRGGPGRDGEIPSLMRGLHRAGVRSLMFDGGSNYVDFNTSGLRVRAIEAGVPVHYDYNLSALGPRDGFMLLHVQQPGDPPPCRRLDDGQGVYVELGNPLVPFPLYTFICPGRRPAVYKRTAPVPAAVAAAVTGDITGRPRRLMVHVMRAMRSQGVKVVEFDPGSANVPFFPRAGLQKLAKQLGLNTPAGYAPQTLGPHDAFMLRHSAGPTDPPPCGRFADGTGLYIVLGNPLIPFGQYRFYCPVRSPRFYHAGHK